MFKSRRLEGGLLLCAISITMMLAGCGGGSLSVGVSNAGTQGNPEQNTNAQNFVTVNITQSSGLPGHPDYKSNLVIQDASSWSNVWAEHQVNQTPQKVLPNVDFNREQVIGIVRTSSNGCTKPSIQNVYFLSTKILIEVAEQDPPSDYFCSQEQSTYVQFVVIERSNLPVEFIDLPASSS